MCESEWKHSYLCFIVEVIRSDWIFEDKAESFARKSYVYGYRKEGQDLMEAVLNQCYDIINDEFDKNRKITRVITSNRDCYIVDQLRLVWKLQMSISCFNWVIGRAFGHKGQIEELYRFRSGECYHCDSRHQRKRLTLTQ